MSAAQGYLLWKRREEQAWKQYRLVESQAAFDAWAFANSMRDQAFTEAYL